MLRQGLSLLLGLCVASLLPGTPGALCHHARGTVRLPVPGRARDVRQPGTGTGGAALCSVPLHCCRFLALSLLLAALCLGCSLRRKAERQRREEKAWTRSVWPRSCCLPDCSPPHDQGIGRQEETSASLKSFLRHLRQRCLRGDALQRGKSKKDLDEEAALSSVGDNNIC